MNTVGKIFVSLIAIMSIVFFSLSLVVYASHKNWKDDSAAKAKQISSLQNEKNILSAQKEDLEKKIESDKTSYEQAIGALHEMVQYLQTENDRLTTDVSKLNRDLQQRVEVITANEAMIKDYQVSIETLHKNLASAQEQRAGYLQTLAETINRLHELASVRGDLEQKNKELTVEFDKALTVLNMNGLEPTPELYEKTLPFSVKGSILAVQDGPKGLIMISLGADDGLKPGHQLEVSHEGSYLGKIEVVTTEPNRAVARILPEYRQGTMKEGDDVSSKFE